MVDNGVQEHLERLIVLGGRVEVAKGGSDRWCAVLDGPIQSDVDDDGHPLLGGIFHRGGS